MPSIATALAPHAAKARALAPGLALAGVIAAAASFLSGHYGAPVMLFALLTGMAFNFLADHEATGPGVAFASRTLLRAGVALLGLRITFADVAELGGSGLIAILGLMALTIATGFLAARLFGRGWRFALLTGGSVAICGASAALALASVIPTNDKLERNTLFTVVSVTTLSTVAMVVYPLLFGALGLDDRTAGVLIGATVHDVAQVVGAGYTISDEAGEAATLVKLLRVAMLPVVLSLVMLTLAFARAGGAGARPGLPAFVVVFAALATLNSFGLAPASVAETAAAASTAMLVTAIAALGIKTALSALVSVGGGHVAIIVLETLVLLAGGLALVQAGVFAPA